MCRDAMIKEANDNVGKENMKHTGYGHMSPITRQDRARPMIVDVTRKQEGGL